MIHSSTALVTGATGYIGSCLVKRLVAEQWNVHIIVRTDSDLTQLSGLETKLHIHRHDESTDGLIKIVALAKPDLVIHLASLFLAQHKPADVIPLIQSNIVFGTQLVEAMSVNNVNRLLNTGTSWQHYQNLDYSPVCLYAATKQAFEAMLQYYVESKSIRAITLELFDTFGPRDPRPKLFHLLRKISLSGEQLEMSPGDQLLDIVYIDDVLEAYLTAAKRLLDDRADQHEHYMVSTGRPLSLKEVALKYELATGRRLSIRWGGRAYRDREVMLTWNRGNILPGWTARVSLEEGIKRIEQNIPLTR